MSAAARPHRQTGENVSVTSLTSNGGGWSFCRSVQTNAPAVTMSRAATTSVGARSRIHRPRTDYRTVCLRGLNA
jgi:hypothetical protein